MGPKRRMRHNVEAMVGVVLMLLAMFVVGPIAVFLGGALWSALFGWVLTDSVAPVDAEADADVDADAGAGAATAPA